MPVADSVNWGSFCVCPYNKKPATQEACYLGSTWGLLIFGNSQARVTQQQVPTHSGNSRGALL